MYVPLGVGFGPAAPSWDAEKGRLTAQYADSAAFLDWDALRARFELATHQGTIWPAAGWELIGGTLPMRGQVLPELATTAGGGWLILAGLIAFGLWAASKSRGPREWR